MNSTRQRLFIFISVLSITCITAKAGYSAQYWAKTYDGSSYENSYLVRQTSDGGFIIVGDTYSFGYGSDDAWVVKFDEKGNITWEKTYGGSSSDKAHAIQETTDGGYILTGTTYSFGAGSSDLLILKLNNTGNIDWQKAYGGDDGDEGWSIQQTSDGGYIVAGVSQSFAYYYEYLWLLRLNSSGDIIWQKIYGYFTEMYSTPHIQQTSDGGYIVLSDHCNAMLRNYKPFLLKLDTNGDALWEENLIPESTISYGNSVQETSDEGYIVAGSYDDEITNGSDGFIVKLDNYGYIEWKKAYRGGGNDYIRSIQETGDGGYIVTGETNSFDDGYVDIWILKLDNIGNVSWQKTYKGINYYTNANSIQEIQGGDFIVTGDLGNEIFLLKITSDGEIPNCNIGGASDAIISDIDVFAQGETYTIQDTFATITDTSITPLESSTDSTVMCCYGTDDYDCDDVLDGEDNCPEIANPDQFDTRPPGGNNCGDACECESDLDDSGAVDGVDTNLYKADYGRNPYKYPCTNDDPCPGDLDCSGAVDGVDTNLYKQDYGRNKWNNPCPPCSGYTCVYP